MNRYGLISKPPAVTDPDHDGAIQAFVPLPDERRKPGRKPGWKKPPAESTEQQLAKQEPTARAELIAMRTTCPGCSHDTTGLDLAVTRELVRSSRDRLDGAPQEVRAHIAETDMLYLAARLDGYCSLSCWKDHQS